MINSKMDSRLTWFNSLKLLLQGKFSQSVDNSQYNKSILSSTSNAFANLDLNSGQINTNALHQQSNIVEA